jgi:hypothetical protein
MYVRNLKTSTIELNEKIYVDKPIKKLKEIPIESQHTFATTFNSGRENSLIKSLSSHEDENYIVNTKD